MHRSLTLTQAPIHPQGHAKIADFGISRFKDPFKSFISVTHTGGTPQYMAPELFNGMRVNEKCDVYSLGCILYECLSRRVPFQDMARCVWVVVDVTPCHIMHEVSLWGRPHPGMTLVTPCTRCL